MLGSCTKDTLPGTDTTTPPSLETDTGAEAFEGWIRVKFKSGNDEIAPVVTKSGALSTGLASVDNAALALGARQMKRVFPPAGRFEERTAKEGLHLWYDLYFDESIP
ncbi:MAG: subtilase family N-terminal domain-containing protein [Alistipes indistinctus]